MVGKKFKSVVTEMLYSNIIAKILIDFLTFISIKVFLVRTISTRILNNGRANPKIEFMNLIPRFCFNNIQL